MARNMFLYVSGTKEIDLVYGKGEDAIIGYTDSDYAGDKVSRKSKSGFAFVRAYSRRWLLLME